MQCKRFIKQCTTFIKQVCNFLILVDFLLVDSFVLIFDDLSGLMSDGVKGYNTLNMFHKIFLHARKSKIDVGYIHIFSKRYHILLSENIESWLRKLLQELQC